MVLFLIHKKKVINLFRDYSFFLSGSKCKTKNGEELKILTSKQILQRLPIALAQAGNTSENLLSNNLMNSIKL